MIAVSPELKSIILEIQNLPSVSEFALGGGTNLALRYQHRISIDIDFISSVVVGKAGLKKIVSEVRENFGSKLMTSILINQDLDEQFMFLRMLVKADNEIVKVEFLQNMKCLSEPEIINKIRMVDKNDIGLFKLMSATNRFAKKDIYDLDFITDEVGLKTLFELLSEKQAIFNLPEHRCLFDLDVEKNVLGHPELLLEFDEPQHTKSHRPFHTHDRIDIVEGSKSWTEARISWRMKVRILFSYLGKDFPKPKGKSL